MKKTEEKSGTNNSDNIVANMTTMNKVMLYVPRRGAKLPRTESSPNFSFGAGVTDGWLLVVWFVGENDMSVNDTIWRDSTCNRRFG